MLEILEAINEMLERLPSRTIGEYVKTEDVFDMLLDLRSLAAREKVPA